MFRFFFVLTDSFHTNRGRDLARQLYLRNCFVSIKWREPSAAARVGNEIRKKSYGYETRGFRVEIFTNNIDTRSLLL